MGILALFGLCFVLVITSISCLALYVVDMGTGGDGDGTEHDRA